MDKWKVILAHGFLVSTLTAITYALIRFELHQAAKALLIITVFAVGKLSMIIRESEE